MLSEEKYLIVINVQKGEILAKQKLFEKGLIASVPHFSFGDNMISLYGRSIFARDEAVFKTKNKIKGRYSFLFEIDDHGHIMQTDGMPKMVRIKKSKLNNKARIYFQDPDDMKFKECKREGDE